MTESSAKNTSYVVTVQPGQMAAVKDVFNQNADLGKITNATSRMLRVISSKSLEEMNQALSGKASVAPETFGTAAADEAPLVLAKGPLGRVAPI